MVWFICGCYNVCTLHHSIQVGWPMRVWIPLLLSILGDDLWRGKWFFSWLFCCSTNLGFKRPAPLPVTIRARPQSAADVSRFRSCKFCWRKRTGQWLRRTIMTNICLLTNFTRDALTLYFQSLLLLRERCWLFRLIFQFHDHSLGVYSILLDFFFFC